MLLVVADEFASLASDLLEDVVDEGVHDRHAALADARLGVHLLQHTINVHTVGFSLVLGGRLLRTLSVLRRRFICVLRLLLGRSLLHDCLLV